MQFKFFGRTISIFEPKQAKANNPVTVLESARKSSSSRGWFGKLLSLFSSSPKISQTSTTPTATKEAVKATEPPKITKPPEIAKAEEKAEAAFDALTAAEEKMLKVEIEAMQTPGEHTQTNVQQARAELSAAAENLKMAVAAHRDALILAGPQEKSSKVDAAKGKLRQYQEAKDAADRFVYAAEGEAKRAGKFKVSPDPKAEKVVDLARAELVGAVQRQAFWDRHVAKEETKWNAQVKKPGVAQPKGEPSRLSAMRQLLGNADQEIEKANTAYEKAMQGAHITPAPTKSSALDNPPTKNVEIAHPPRWMEQGGHFAEAATTEIMPAVKSPG